ICNKHFLINKSVCVHPSFCSIFIFEACWENRSNY
ncbi:hypothetical protein NT07LI_4117, partial [Listeria innocua FSL S4-378]